MTLIAKLPRSLAGVALLLTSCATAGSSVEVSSQGSGSPYFSLGRPSVYRQGEGLRLVGRVCRRGRTTLLSPPRVRLERVASTGDVVDVARAGVPAIYGRSDQACTSNLTTLNWRFASGESVRACFDRGRSCSGDPGAKVAAPTPAPPPP